MAETVERQRRSTIWLLPSAASARICSTRWEATALIESLGYTDARIRREFGYPDTAALGVYVFDGAARPAPTQARRRSDDT